MLTNKISYMSNIGFGANQKVSRNPESENAILMLRDANASIKFQQNQEFAQNADSINANPLKALGYKLYRTFNMIRENDNNQPSESKQFSAIA